MDKEQIKKQLKEAFEIMGEEAKDTKSWFGSRLGLISNVTLTDHDKLAQRISLEAEILRLILEALRKNK